MSCRCECVVVYGWVDVGVPADLSVWVCMGGWMWVYLQM